MRYRFAFECEPCVEEWTATNDDASDCWSDCPNCGTERCALTYTPLDEDE